MEKPKQKRGLALVAPALRKKFARMGGLATSSDRKHMSRIGRTGGKLISQDSEHMARIGRKGGGVMAARYEEARRQKLAQRRADE